MVNRRRCFFRFSKILFLEVYRTGIIASRKGYKKPLTHLRKVVECPRFVFEVALTRVSLLKSFTPVNCAYTVN